MDWWSESKSKWLEMPIITFKWIARKCRDSLLVQKNTSILYLSVQKFILQTRKGPVNSQVMGTDLYQLLLALSPSSWIQEQLSTTQFKGQKNTRAHENLWVHNELDTCHTMVPLFSFLLPSTPFSDFKKNFSSNVWGKGVWILGIKAIMTAARARCWGIEFHAVLGEIKRSGRDRGMLFSRVMSTQMSACDSQSRNEEMYPRGILSCHGQHGAHREPWIKLIIACCCSHMKENESHITKPVPGFWYYHAYCWYSAPKSLQGQIMWHQGRTVLSMIGHANIQKQAKKKKILSYTCCSVLF